MTADSGRVSRTGESGITTIEDDRTCREDDTVGGVLSRLRELDGPILCVDRENRIKGVITRQGLSRQLDDVDGLRLDDPVGTYFHAGPASNGHRIEIGDRMVGDGAPTLLIAEIGLNHNGDVDLAKHLVELAKEAGADCVKFQMRSLEALYQNAGDTRDHSQDIGSEYVLDVVTTSHLTPEQMYDVFDHAKTVGIEPLCTPWDLESVDALEKYGLVAFKIASADLGNHELIERAAATGVPLLLSTGMSTEAEIIQSIGLLDRLDVAYALLHCVSTYPAPVKDLNLRYISRLRDMARVPVGYSGHERGTTAAIAAVAAGASIVEKHFTVDRTMYGNDHKVSLLPDEFASMAEAIREVEQAMGEGGTRAMSQGEHMNRVSLSKSLIASRDISSGELITAAMVTTKSPGQGLAPNLRQQLVGRRARRTIEAGSCFFGSDLLDNPVEPRSYRFTRPWGLPVRYHDLDSLAGRSNMDFVEFHLSYKDLVLPVDKAITGEFDLGVVVHAPDILAGDQILDPASPSAETLRISRKVLTETIDVTRQIARHFNHDYGSRPKLVVSAGGCTRDSPLPVDERAKLYEQLRDVLESVSPDDVQIVLQTMPPFPWYFGGQSFANLFVDPQECVAFCDLSGLGLCLDTSHSKLASNHLGMKFTDYVRIIGGHVRHMHVVDASGTDGEGLQIGEGEIDFESLAEVLGSIPGSVGFIPEIWQGHRDRGSGFWTALERLEGYFSGTSVGSSQ